MIGLFKPSPRGFRWVYICINKFSKWIEYKPLVQATSKKVAELLDDIIHQFSLPNSIISDLGSTFISADFWDFYEERCISVKYVLVAHPRTNSQVERANDMILDALKKRLYKNDRKHPGKWLKELPAVVLGLRTQPSCTTGVSPYFMVFSSEVVLPTNIAFRAPRVENYNEENFGQARLIEVDSLEEERLVSCVRTAKYLDKHAKIL
jgi:transposase InsO family protein